MTYLKIEQVDKYFYDDNIFKTYFLTSLSSTFKEGESFFMKAITFYLKQHPELRERIISFCNEERTHSLWHMTLNNLLDIENGNTTLKDLEDKTGLFLKKIDFLPPKLKLLITDVLEHITYCLCETILERVDVLDTLTSDAKTVFIQHCLEETDESHSTLAEDVYKKIKGNRLIRKLAIYPVTLVLILLLINYIIYNYKQNNNFEFFDFITGLNDLIGMNGWVREAFGKSFKEW